MQTYADFVDFITTLTVEQTLWLAIIGLLLFTIGLCLGWLIQRRKTSKLRKELATARRETETYRERVSATDDEQKKLARELVNLTTEKDDILVHLREVQHRNGALQNDLQLLRATNEQLNATNQSYTATIEDLNDQVIGLRTRNEQLQGGNAGADQHSLEQRLRTLEDKIARLAEPRPAATLAPINTGEPTHRVRIGQSLAEVETPKPVDFTEAPGLDADVAYALRDAGLKGWADLAAMPAEEIGAILHQARLDEVNYDVAAWKTYAERMITSGQLSVEDVRP
ncbi:hypothetical protein [Lewinella sp. JB7]|uniref:hypothetical protein n=1 Tax=Lewinella sp. JB7 TaxID=2962887 RepID=UPI0020C9A9E3|nr:hypothetical protein [Lewinella sp. JB7]MCP9237454.1 hypothetical protein [Lewinella sp. JB7]